MIQNISVKGIKVYHRSDLPNSDSYRFIGLDIDGNRYRCEVVKGADGVHRVEGMKFSDMIGWVEE